MIWVQGCGTSIRCCLRKRPEGRSRVAARGREGMSEMIQLRFLSLFRVVCRSRGCLWFALRAHGALEIAEHLWYCLLVRNNDARTPFLGFLFEINRGGILLYILHCCACIIDHWCCCVECIFSRNLIDDRSWMIYTTYVYPKRMLSCLQIRACMFWMVPDWKECWVAYIVYVKGCLRYNGIRSVPNWVPEE